MLCASAEVCLSEPGTDLLPLVPFRQHLAVSFSASEASSGRQAQHHELHVCSDIGTSARKTAKYARDLTYSTEYGSSSRKAVSDKCRMYVHTGSSSFCMSGPG